jgi:hypothetical protein
MSPPEQATRETAYPPAGFYLSLLAKERGKCLWQRFEPLSKITADVAELPTSCCSDPGFHDPGKVAIAHDAARALLACQREPPLLVTLGTGAVKALPGPGRGRLGKLTFGKDGAPLALTLEVNVRFLKDQRGRFVNVDGQRIDANEGSESLVHAFRLGEGGAWSRVETWAEIDPEKVDVLGRLREGKLRTGMGRDRVQVSSEILSLSPELDAELLSIKDPKILTKLKALAPEFGRPPYDEGGWVSYAEHSHSDVSLIAWRGIGDEWHLDAPVFFVRGDQLTELAFRRHDQVAVLSQWPYLLIAEEYSGATPRLYHWRTGAVLFTSDAFAIGFWPTSAASRK